MTLTLARRRPMCNFLANPVPLRASCASVPIAERLMGCLIQRRQQSGHQAAALGEAVDLDVLMERVRIGAANAEAI